MIGLMFLKVLILIKQEHLSSVLFFIVGIFLDKGFRFQSTVFNSCNIA